MSAGEPPIWCRHHSMYDCVVCVSYPTHQHQPKVERPEDLVRKLLGHIGEDPDRLGLLDTPKRVVAAWAEWFGGYDQDPQALMTTFEDGAEQCDQMVVLTDIPVFSHCEHHMTPFVGVAHVAYIPDGRIIGLSKIARLVDLYARRLQVQERLTNQVADALTTHLNPRGVGVVIKAQHFCMVTRGVKTSGVDTTTSALRGVIKDDASCRAEFFELVR